MQSSTSHTELTSLYEKIRQCHICPKMNMEKALRRADAVTLGTDTFIISQALAKTQLRRSGVNFFNLEGDPENTGKKLEQFLNKFDRTIYPHQQVMLSSGAIIPQCKDGFLPVYNTEITQCYPGKKPSGKGDRNPKVGEIGNCIGQGFIKREIEIIRPKLLLLMGNVSREAFYQHFLGKTSANTLADDIDSAVKDGKLPTAEVSGLKFSVLPIHHASVRDSSFHQLTENQRLIEIIQQMLV